MNIVKDGVFADFIAPPLIINDFAVQNLNPFFTAIKSHYSEQITKPRNDIDPKYWVYDIGFGIDLCKHISLFDWEKVFKFFKTDPYAKAVFATRTFNKHLLMFNPDEKVRVRVCIAPQDMLSIFEEHEDPLMERLQAINALSYVGYEVVISYSPFIVSDANIDSWQELFETIDEEIELVIRKEIKGEVLLPRRIKTPEQYDLWKLPENEAVRRWKSLQSTILPWNKMIYK